MIRLIKIIIIFYFSHILHLKLLILLCKIYISNNLSNTNFFQLIETNNEQKPYQLLNLNFNIKKIPIE
jgi:hypothetical protein